MKRLNKIFAFLLVASLLVGLAFPSSVFAAYVEEGSIIPDGEYSVSFRYVKDLTTEVSAADEFMEKDSGKLIISNGEAVFEHKVKKAVYATFAYLAARKDGAAKAVISTVNGIEEVTGKEGYENIVVRDDTTDSNYVVVQYVIDDVWKKQDILMHINDLENYFKLPVRYNHWYNAQLEINATDIVLPENPGNGEEPVDSEVTEELFLARIAEGNTLLADAIEGEYDGNYSVGSKAKLLAKLELAENLVAEDSGNADILEAAYKIVDQAIKAFQASRISVDKTRLEQWIHTASEWIVDRADAGERAAGKASSLTSTPVSDGEYLPLTFHGPEIGYKGPVTDIKEQIAKAMLVLNNAEVTQAQVTEMYNEANAKGNWELFEKQRLAAQDIEIIVLDSLEKDAKESPHAGDLSPHAVLIKQAGPGYYHTFANFALYDEDDVLTDTSLRRLSASGGLFSNNWSTGASPAVKNIDVTNTPIFKSELEGIHSDTIKVYQATVRGASVTDEQWQGLWKLQYPMELPEAERTTVFISFNKSYLENLQVLIDAAEELLDDAVEGTEIGQHSAYYITQLEAAITAALEIADQLSAPRTEILKAEHTLQAVIDTFNEAVTKEVHFTVANSSLAEFSIMNDYFVSPALVETDEEGGLHVTATITNSSSVPEFKIKAGEEYVAVTDVSENSESNTRVVTFKVDSLSNLLDAQVRTVAPNYDKTHNIRLNFNNVDNEELYSLIQTAKSAHKTVTDSGKTDTYYELALLALSNAIALANEEAVRIPSEQTTTDAAQIRLSTALKTFKEVFGNDNGGTDPGTDPGTNPGGGAPVYPANGNYYIPFTIYKSGTIQESVAHKYVVPTALVTVSGSTKTVAFTVLRSKEITGLTLNGSSGEVVSTDTEKNQRIVKFTVDNLSSTLGGWVKVDWDEADFSYHHEYTIQFKFHESQAIYAGENPSVPGTGYDPGTPGLPVPGAGTDEEKEEAAEEEQQEQEQNEQEPGTNNGNPAVAFSDVANHWAKTSIEKAIQLGIVNGYADGSFRPNATVTRGEFAVMISRALKLQGNGDKAALNDFANIATWAQDHVARVVEAGIITGYADATFRSNDQLTRAQLAVMIARAGKLQLNKNAEVAFADSAQIPAWAQKEVAAAVKAGLLLGKENNSFDPNGTATRAETLTLIIRLLELASK